MRMIPKYMARDLNRQQRRHFDRYRREAQRSVPAGAGSFLMGALLAPYMPKLETDAGPIIPTIQPMFSPGVSIRQAGMSIVEGMLAATKRLFRRKV